MANIALNKPSGGQLIIAPEDGTSTETITVASKERMAFRVYAVQAGTRPLVWQNYDLTTKPVQTYDYSQGSMNLSTGEWTVPESGLYYMSVQYTPTLNGDIRSLVKLYKNGSKWDEIIDSEAADYFMSHDLNWSTVLYANSGDVFKLWEETNHTGNGGVQWACCYLGKGA